MHVNTSTTTASSSNDIIERASDHTIEFETWVGYNSTWKYFKVNNASAKATRTLLH